VTIKKEKAIGHPDTETPSNDYSLNDSVSITRGLTWIKGHKQEVPSGESETSRYRHWGSPNFRCHKNLKNRKEGKRNRFMEKNLLNKKHVNRKLAFARYKKGKRVYDLKSSDHAIQRGNTGQQNGTTDFYKKVIRVWLHIEVRKEGLTKALLFLHTTGGGNQRGGVRVGCKNSKRVGGKGAVFQVSRLLSKKLTRHIMICARKITS